MTSKLTPTTADDLQLIVEQITSGKPLDREAAKRSLEILNREREELRRRIGTVDVAVELIRETRDQ